MEETRSKFAIPVAIIVAGLAVAGAVFFADNDKPVRITTFADPIAKNQTTEPRPVSLDDHILGNPLASVFIIEYADPECPFCKELHPTLHSLMNEYGKSGKVAWVYRQFPIVSLHSKAMTEAEALECAAELGGNQKFWNYLDRLYELTPSNNGLDLALLPQIASEVGIDTGAFNICLSSNRTQTRIEKDLEDGLAAGVTGTPYTIIVTSNGTLPVEGIKPILAWKALLNQALGE